MSRPDPLVPPEVDLRDFGFMPLDVRTLLTSSLWIKSKKDPRVAHAAVSLWCECWHQVPAASLPDDDEVLAELARCDADEWARVRDRALLHFVKCSDGRLYHRHVAAKALESWGAKLAQRERTRAASEAKARKKAAIEAAAKPADETPKGVREQPANPHRASADVHRDDDRDDKRHGERHDTRNDERDDDRHGDRHELQGTGTGTGTGIEEKGKRAPGSPAHAHEPAGVRARTREDPEPEDQHPEPVVITPSGAVCKAMRQAGLSQTNPSDPRLHAMLAQGATEAEFVTVAREAVDKGIASPWPWVLRVVAARRQEAAAIALAPAAPHLRNGRADPTTTTPTPAGAVYTPPPPLTPEEKAAADAAREKAMDRLGRRRKVVT